MKRAAAAVLFLGLFLYLNNTGHAQGGTKDCKVKYRVKDTGKEDSVTGVIQEESLEGIAVKSGTKLRRIPAEDIIDVDYMELVPVAERPTIRKGLKAEADRKYEDAIGIYSKLKIADKKAARHFEYKAALLTARMADADPAELKNGIAALEKFLKNHPDSWQVINFPKLLVPLQLAAKDTEGAERTLKALSSNERIPPGLRQELDLVAAKILLEGRKYDEAEKKLESLIKGAKDPAQQFRLRIQLAECMSANKKFPKAKAELTDIIAKTNNNDMKAVALNTLGEACRTNNETREAMWNFLYVDVLYNQNKDEHQRAIKNLADVFKQLNDAKKAKQYADMLKGK
jgi:predicted Zn-dependent protease